MYPETAKFIVAMIIMMNPLGSLSIYLQLTKRFTLDEQRKTALKCMLAMVVFMMITIWVGDQFLNLLGITIASFRVAGGIILFLVGLSMLQSKESPLSHTPEDDAAAKGKDSIAIVPMALPIIIGPGVISTLILASNDYPAIAHKFWFSLLCVFLAVGMGMMLFFSGFIARRVGDSMIKVITRIMGMVIMAIAVGMFSNGLMDIFPALH